MVKSEQTKTPLMPFVAVAMAPVLAFALSNALFLPIADMFIDFDDSILTELLLSANNGPVNYLIVALIILLSPVVMVLVLFSPALTSFLMNLIYPVLTNWPRAAWSGIVFFLFHTIFQAALLIYRFLGMNPTIYDPRPYSSFFDPLAFLLLLAGIVLSGSVAVAGRLGAQKGHPDV